MTIEVSAWVVGPALGGLLLAQSLRPWTLVVAVVAGRPSGWSAATGIIIPGPVEKAPDAVAGMLREVLHCRPALGALGLAGLLNLVVTVTGVVLLPLSEESGVAATPAFGLATACLGFGALGAPLLARLVGGSAAPRRPAAWWRSASRSPWSPPRRCRGRRCRCSPWPAPVAWSSRAC